MDWAEKIIETGYKELLKENHPDRFALGQRPKQDEICKRLSLARDWLHLLRQQRQVKVKERRIREVPSADPLGGLDELIDQFTQVLGATAKRGIRNMVRPRKRRV
jgi:hypothetical protein